MVDPAWRSPRESADTSMNHEEYWGRMLQQAKLEFFEILDILMYWDKNYIENLEYEWISDWYQAFPQSNGYVSYPVMEIFLKLERTNRLARGQGIRAWWPGARLQ